MTYGGQAEALDSLLPSNRPSHIWAFPVAGRLNTAITCRLNQLKLTKCTIKCLSTEELKRNELFSAKR